MKEPNPSPRDLSLDFLRGLAILLVLDFHFEPHASLLSYPLHALGWQHFGWIGVDLFFVLSGFLVGGLLVREWTARGTLDSRRFLIRRGFKIWPQYYLLVLVILALHPGRWRTLVPNLLNIQNYTAGGSGFDAPLPHTWSLAVEEHFYLLLIAVFGFAIARRVRLRTLFLSLAAAALAVSLGRMAWFLSGGINDVYTHLRLDGLLWGVLLALLYHRAPARFQALHTRWWWLVPVAAIAVFRFQHSILARAVGISFADWTGVALVLLLFRPASTSADPHSRTLPPDARSDTPAQVPLTPTPRRPGPPNPLYRLIAWLGLNSYGIYLWHESVLGPTQSLARRTSGAAALLILATLPWLLAITAGVSTTRLLEIPMLRLRDRLFPRPGPPPADQ